MSEKWSTLGNQVYRSGGFATVDLFPPGSQSEPAFTFMASFAKFAQLRWDSSTGTPRFILKKGTLVKVITKSKERFLVEAEDGSNKTQVWVDSNDLEPPSPTRYERLSGDDEI